MIKIHYWLLPALITSCNVFADIQLANLPTSKGLPEVQVVTAEAEIDSVQASEIIPAEKTGFLAQKIDFFRSFLKNAGSIGAIAPSSDALATAMTEYFLLYKKPLRILEVGAGTGVFTKKIIENMPAGSHCDVVELDQSFCEKYLQPQFGSRSDVTIHAYSVLDAPLAEQYDYIVSGLPFHSLPIELVDNILKLYVKILKPTGILTYFEYAFLPSLKQSALFIKSKEDYLEFKAKRQLLKAFQKLHMAQKDIVWDNFPPARVVTNLGSDLQDYALGFTSAMPAKAG